MLSLRCCVGLPRSVSVGREFVFDVVEERAGGDTVIVEKGGDTCTFSFYDMFCKGDSWPVPPKRYLLCNQRTAWPVRVDPI